MKDELILQMEFVTCVLTEQSGCALKTQTPCMQGGEKMVEVPKCVAFLEHKICYVLWEAKIMLSLEFFLSKV